MFSLLAIVVTAVLVGSALLWRAVRSPPRVRPAAVLRALWRRGAILVARLSPSRIAPKVARNWWRIAR